MEPPGLRPAHVGNAVRQEPAFPEIEELPTTAHVLQHPTENPVCKILVFLAFLREEADGLGGGMDVYRIGTIVIVFWSTIFQEEAVGVILDAPAIGSHVFRRQSPIQDVPNGLKVETGVEGVDPVVAWTLRVRPGTVIVLVFHAVGQGRQGGIEKGLVAGDLCDANEQRRSQ